MNKHDIEKWINNAKPNESVIYFTGHLGEDREWDLDHKKEINETANAFIKAVKQHLGEDREWDLGRKKEINETANAFIKAVKQKKIDLFQKKIKEGDSNHKPIYEYIARKLKSKKFNFKIEDSSKYKTEE